MDATTATTALRRLGILAERLEDTTRTYTHLLHISEVYEPAMHEMPELEARENEFLLRS